MGDHAAVQALCGNRPGKELTRYFSGSNWPQPSQPAEPPWTDPGIKSGIRVCELISTSFPKIFFKVQMGNEWLNIQPKSSQARKKPPRCAETCDSTISYYLSVFVVFAVLTCLMHEMHTPRCTETCDPTISYYHSVFIVFAVLTCLMHEMHTASL